jgi:drug/metabolite transporter (DMT)-like permease
VIGELCALGAAVCWSASVVLFKQSESVSPLGMNLFKNVSAACLLAITMPLSGASFDLGRSRGEWVQLVVSGALGIALADTLVFVALRKLGAGLLAVVDCVYAPLLVLLSVIWLRERPTPIFAVGAALVVAGVICATAERAKQSTTVTGPRIGGILTGVTAIAVMGVGVMMAKPALEHGALVEVTLVRILAAVAAQALWIALRPSARSALAALRPSATWRTLLPASILGSYVAMLMWRGGFKWAQASRAAVLNQLSTVFTIVLARIYLGEPVSRLRAIGAGAALAGALTILLGAR